MNHKNIFLLSSLLIFYSCQSTEDNKKYQIHLETEFKSEIRLSEIIQPDYRSLILKIPENEIGVISKILFQEDFIYIIDRDIAKKVFVFDKFGEFKFSVGTPGEGPGEHSNLSDFLVADDHFLIVDNHGFKFIYFDLEGNYVKEVKTDTFIKEVMVSEDANLIALVPSNYHKSDRGYEANTIQILNAKTLKEIKGFLPYTENLDDAPIYGTLNSYKGEYLYLRPVYGDIISIENLEDYHKKIQIDYGIHSWPISFEDIANNQEQSEQLFYKGGIVTLFNSLVFDDNYLVYQGVMNRDEKNGNKVDYESGEWLFLYNRKDTTNNKCLSINRVVNDINGLQIDFPIALSEDNYFVSVAINEESQDSVAHSLFFYKLDI